jgi:predicted GIY-YIG superfamily endonuclease
MRQSPKTIQIYLPGGDPRGIRIAEITTRIVQIIEVPRNLLAEFLKMDECGQVAVYFLVGGDESEGTSKVYVGQTSDLKNRLSTHNQKKDFWGKALVLISKTNSLTQTHALYLEWQCIKAIASANRFKCENGNEGSRPHTPAPLEADCNEIFETGSTLLATLGFPFFDAVGITSEAEKDEEIFFCKGSGADGRAIYTNEGLVVLKGSSGKKGNVESIQGTSDEKFRHRLVESGIMKEIDGRYVFQKDHLFDSPSSAAVALMGRTANGWLEWKSKDGNTLDELKRKPAE